MENPVAYCSPFSWQSMQAALCLSMLIVSGPTASGKSDLAVCLLKSMVERW